MKKLKPRKPKKIESLDELKQICSKGYTEVFILLNFGLRSSKEIEYDTETDTWRVFNYIDDSELIGLTYDELKTDTNIPLALERGALFKY